LSTVCLFYTRKEREPSAVCYTDDSKGVGLSYLAIDHRVERVIYSWRLYNIVGWWDIISNISCWTKNVEHLMPSTYVNMVCFDNDAPVSDRGCRISDWPEGSALMGYALCWVWLV
jgi:hypothetical protein